MSTTNLWKAITVLATLATAAPAVASDVSADQREMALLRSRTQLASSSSVNQVTSGTPCTCGAASYSAGSGSTEPAAQAGRSGATGIQPQAKDVDYGESARVVH